MAIELIDKIKPKNNGGFAMVDAADVEMPDGTRLSEYNPGTGLPDVSGQDENKILQVVGGKIIPVKVEDSSVKTFVDDYISSALEGDY